MEIPTYVFQSPYPSAIQVGRPDPQAVSETNDKEAVDALSQAGNESAAEAKAYISQVSAPVSVNVAQSSTNSELTSSLETFSEVNKQVQAVEAYTR